MMGPKNVKEVREKWLANEKTLVEPKFNQGFIFSEADGARTRNLRIDSPVCLFLGGRVLICGQAPVILRLPSARSLVFMRLQKVLERVLTERVLDPVTADQYARAVRKFEESLGRPAMISDLTYENINAWLSKMQLAPVTICNYRRSILVIWNYLASIGDIDPYAKQRIRKPKLVPQIVRSWEVDQLCALVAAAEKIPGFLRCGIPATDFLMAWLWVGFDTGLRPVDLRLLKWKNVHLKQACVTIVQNKTKQPHTAALSGEAISSLKLLEGYHPQHVFPLSKGGVRRWELKLFNLASQLGFTRLEGEGLGRLRSMHATEIYKADGLSAAAESLGHIGGTRTVRAHYIDARAVHMGRLPRRPQDGIGKADRGGT